MNGQDNVLLQELVRDTIRRWRSGEKPDADALLQRHPALSADKGLAIDLIYEEYCLRHEQGDTLVPSTFCERFPHYQQSLCKMLEVHEALEQSSLPTAPATKTPWPTVGESFMGYQLVEALGRGSLARVFLAREDAIGSRFVVVKISRNGASEAQMLGKAAHPGIVPILSVRHDESTGWTVICMPLLGTATAADLHKAAFAGGRAAGSAGHCPGRDPVSPRRSSPPRAPRRRRCPGGDPMRRRRPAGAAIGRGPAGRPRGGRDAPRHQAFERALGLVRPADAARFQSLDGCRIAEPARSAGRWPICAGMDGSARLR